MRIAVLMGGTSPERQVSMASGRGVVRALEKNGHAVSAVDAADGSVIPLERLDALARIGTEPPAVTAGSRRGLAACRPLLEADLAFVMVHGGEGEDGTLQAFLDIMGIPYTGSGMRSCALTWDKEVTRRLLTLAGVPVAPGFFIPAPAPDDGFDVPAVDAGIGAVSGYPVIVKPNQQGSTIGVTRLESAAGLEAALRRAAAFPGGVLVERFIPGHELTVAVFDEEVYPATEIVADTGFYDYERKYQKGHTRYVTPAEIPADRAAELKRLSRTACRTFDCAGVARVDFRMEEDGALYCLEINTVPGMTELSLVPMGARAAGIDYPELVERMARGALATRRGGA